MAERTQKVSVFAVAGSMVGTGTDSMTGAFGPAIGPPGAVIARINVAWIIAPILQTTRSARSLIRTVVGAIVTTNIVTADLYVAVALRVRIFNGTFAAHGLVPVVLSRSAGFSAMRTSDLVPRNSYGACMAATLGISTRVCMPYAVFNSASLLPLIRLGVARSPMNGTYRQPDV